MPPLSSDTAENIVIGLEKVDQNPALIVREQIKRGMLERGILSLCLFASLRSLLHVTQD